MNAMQPLRHNSHILASERGFTMIVTLGVMLVSSLLMVAAFTAANGDIHLTQTDTAGKRAYYAAQAGISNYAYHLAQDSNYLTYCTTPTPENPALNPRYKKSTYIPLKSSELTNRAEVPGSQGQEKYAIQLLPAETSPPGSPGEKEECNKNNVVGSMIEQKGEAAGTFRLQSTGFAEGRERTIVATFRNLNFVSFVWYSVYETGDSVLYPAPQPNCARYFGERPGICTEFDNYFIEGESVNGPMHTEDHVRICGKPTFGRNPNDRIEFGNGKNKKEGEKGYSNEACGAGPPNFKGTLIPPSKTLSIKPPPGDEELQHIVEKTPTNYEYTGKTEIALTGETMTVTEHKGAGATGYPETEEKTKAGVAFPPSGVIYVANSGGCSLYSPFGPSPSYTADTTCGNVYVHGIYEKPLTIAAENDVVINGNITTKVSGETPTTNAMLGLIANNFVRVFHPLTGAREKKYGKGNKPLGPCLKSENDTTVAPKDLENLEIYAAILAVKHSFIVDNFDCGTPTLGQIKVYGAIAGLFTNGMTGVFSGKTVLSGYGYNLIYDNRLQVAEPPHFLNPIQAAWVVQRETLAPSP